MTAAPSSDPDRSRLEEAVEHIRGRSRLMIGGLIAIIVYLIFSWFSFDVGGILSRSDPDSASTLVQDSVSHRVHAELDLRRGGWEFSVEGVRDAVYQEDPEWVTRDAEGEGATLDLGDGVEVYVFGRNRALRSRRLWPVPHHARRPHLHR